MMRVTYTKMEAVDHIIIRVGKGGTIRAISVGAITDMPTENKGKIVGLHGVMLPRIGGGKGHS